MGAHRISDHRGMWLFFGQNPSQRHPEGRQLVPNPVESQSCALSDIHVFCDKVCGPVIQVIIGAKQTNPAAY